MLIIIVNYVHNINIRDCTYIATVIIGILERTNIIFESYLRVAYIFNDN